MNFWMEPVLSRAYWSRTSDPSDTALGYIGDLQFKLFKLLPREIYTTT